MVALKFLGTRGGIVSRSRRHWRHSALLVQHKDARIMIDCGADWLGQLRAIAPTAIVLTHAHPDHAAGLAGGAPCPVYATRASWRLLRRFPIRDRRKIPLQGSINIAGLKFEAFPVEHSVRVPAVGYRVSAKGACFFYVPDLARLPRVSHALRRVELYIGDGATIKRSMVRKANGRMIGHAPVALQLDWCAKARVRRAIFTHCGSPIVRDNGRAINSLVRQLGRGRGINARVANDGDRLLLASRMVRQKAKCDWNAGFRVGGTR